MAITTVSTVGQLVSAVTAPQTMRRGPRAVFGIVASNSCLTTGAPRRAFIRTAAGLGIGLAAVAAAPGVDPSVLLDAPAKVWDAYQTQLTANPIATKAAISGLVYFVGDLIAQAYEGLTDGAVDSARAVRSGLCGFLAHGPLSHFWYLFCDNAIAELPVSPHAWYVPILKISFDQTVWSATWNGTYYGLLGVLRREPPAVIAESVRTSCLDLMMAGWKLWPAAHLVTYGLIPREHRLLWVDTVEILWVIILSTYGQHQRQAVAAADTALAVHAEPGLPEQLLPQEVPVVAVPVLPVAAE